LATACEETASTRVAPVFRRSVEPGLPLSGLGGLPDRKHGGIKPAADVLVGFAAPADEDVIG
jgi:hypothetical protein